MSILNEISDQLRKLKPALERKYHVTSIALFGSVVRADFAPTSDIDILVDFRQQVGIEFIDLANELEQELHRKVDLVSRKGIKDKYFRVIERELVCV